MVDDVLVVGGVFDDTSYAKLSWWLQDALRGIHPCGATGLVSESFMSPQGAKMSMVGRYSLSLACFATARVCHHFSNHFSVPEIFDSFPGCYFVSTSTVVFLLLELHLLVFQITTTLATACFACKATTMCSSWLASAAATTAASARL